MFRRSNCFMNCSLLSSGLPEESPDITKAECNDCDAGLWSVIRQIKSKLPLGSVLDDLIPYSSIRVLGLLYRDSNQPNDGGPMNSAIWQDGNLVCRMSSAGREEARSNLASMMEFAVMYQLSESKKMKLSHHTAHTHMQHLVPVNPESSNEYIKG